MGSSVNVERKGTPTMGCEAKVSVAASDVAAVFVGDEHAVGMAFGKEAGLFERHRGTYAPVFADDAYASLRLAIVMRAAIKNHAPAALGALLFR